MHAETDGEGRFDRLNSGREAIPDHPQPRYF
jgi:hypothetical protein